MASREAVRAGRLHDGRRAEGRKREAVAVRLLEAEEAVIGTAGRQHGRRDVQLGRDADRHGGDGRAAAAPRQGERTPYPLGEQPLLGGGEAEGRFLAGDSEHDPKDA